MRVLKREEFQDIFHRLSNPEKGQLIIGGWESYTGAKFIVIVEDINDDGSDVYCIPNFHIMSENFDCALTILNLEYYFHEEFKGTLDDKQFLELLEFFELEADEIPINKFHISNWEKILWMWSVGTDHIIKVMNDRVI